MTLQCIRRLLQDIQASHAAGCTAIGVATGHFDAAALKEAGADHVVETMEEPFAFLSG